MSADSSSIIRDHLYSMEDKLKRGRPPPLLKGAGEDTVIDGEPAPEVDLVIDPTSISRVLDAIFLSKACDSTLRPNAPTCGEAMEYRDTHLRLFMGEFTPTLEDPPCSWGYVPLLDQVQFLEKGAVETVAVETLLNSSFLQVFLWEWFKGIEVSPLLIPRPRNLLILMVVCCTEETSSNLPMVPTYAKEGPNFLELLDNVESFIFRPYCALSEGFRHVPLYADSDDLIEVPETTARGRRLRREAMLSAACFPLPTLGDDHLEASVFWTGGNVSEIATSSLLLWLTRGTLVATRKLTEITGIAALLHLVGSMPLIVTGYSGCGPSCSSSISREGHLLE
ncbi:uncharacterized protein Pyn_12880 [Prunus yedoensis var. nudiflora]|uniref:Aminotransferase-like plant mobile domain-containing protein n=1 Tax=Prunus yedoensis var. nudiflora TaxID=2094558 RepID=A0A314XIH5_PRUYE|nr:uncharacterized protein Pyn_12880 [Prunus yedoensis var. nudiflora]